MMFGLVVQLRILVLLLLCTCCPGCYCKPWDYLAFALLTQVGILLHCRVRDAPVRTPSKRAKDLRARSKV